MTVLAGNKMQNGTYAPPPPSSPLSELDRAGVEDYFQALVREGAQVPPPPLPRLSDVWNADGKNIDSDKQCSSGGFRGVAAGAPPPLRQKKSYRLCFCTPFLKIRML